MTDTEIISALARFMGWKKEKRMTYPHRMQGNKEVWGYVRPNNTFTWRWNPMKSWDQWRVVEEKVMEDEELFMDYTLAIWNAPPDGYCCKKQVAADLPTRCKALVSILPKNEDE